MEPIDYQAVLADLEARRSSFNAAIDSAIQSIRHILSMATVGGPHTPHVITPGSAGRHGAPYLGMNLVEAAKKHLATVRSPQSNAQIADALTEGGFVHNSQNFTNTVGTALWRAEENGDREIFRSGRLWYLKEWAPNFRKAVSLNPKDAVSYPDDDSSEES